MGELKGLRGRVKYSDLEKGDAKACTLCRNWQGSLKKNWKKNDRNKLNVIQSLPDPDLKCTQSTSKTPGHTALGVSIAKEKGMGFFSEKVTFSFQTIQNSLCIRSIYSQAKHGLFSAVCKSPNCCSKTI